MLAARKPAAHSRPERGVGSRFMTIPEAVQLVIQAGALGEGGDVFVLDMGEPVRILDLARDMVRLSGFEPDVDIPIRIVGARPGEKVAETLVGEGEAVEPTRHPKILRLQGAPVDAAGLGDALTNLVALVGGGAPAESVKAALVGVANGIWSEVARPVHLVHSILGGKRSG